MKIVRFEVGHLWQIRAQPRQAALISSYLTQQYVDVLARGLAYSALEGPRVIACAGIVTQFAGVGTLWAMLADDAGRHLLGIHRTALRVIGMSQLRRLEASSEANFPQGCRWLELLGFENEGTMKKYGPDGEDHNRYARVSS